MTGRNRSEKLSDAQRSALWYAARGYQIHRGKAGPSGAVWLRAPHGGGTLAIHHFVLKALLSRSLVEVDRDAGGSVAYRMTEKGKEVAREFWPDLGGGA